MDKWCEINLCQAESIALLVLFYVNYVPSRLDTSCAQHSMLVRYIAFQSRNWLFQTVNILAYLNEDVSMRARDCRYRVMVMYSALGGAPGDFWWLFYSCFSFTYLLERLETRHLHYDIALRTCGIQSTKSLQERHMAVQQ